jgi:hypothetical protein
MYSGIEYDSGVSNNNHAMRCGYAARVASRRTHATNTLRFDLFEVQMSGCADAKCAHVSEDAPQVSTTQRMVRAGARSVFLVASRLDGGVKVMLLKVAAGSGVPSCERSELDRDNLSDKAVLEGATTTAASTDLPSRRADSRSAMIWFCSTGWSMMWCEVGDVRGAAGESAAEVSTEPSRPIRLILSSSYSSS